MKIHTTNSPTEAAGKHISKLIAEHDGDVVCLLSGGSALNVVKYIEVERKNASTNECRTIFMMGDERGSRESAINNSLQFFSRYRDHAVASMFMPTVPEEHESLEQFAVRIEKIFLKIFSELKNVKIISLLGMGPDGHTAGIFPLPKELFAKVYRDDLMYAPVHVERLTIDSRASFTPVWLLEHVDAIIGYVTGTGKKMMLESLINESRSLHERPAELFKLHKDVQVYTDITLQGL
jgi:6-phosphogluconolactonase/glucosamine-6-phosphate isomerase/deaminase